MRKWTRLGATAGLATLLAGTAWAQTIAPAPSPSSPPGASTIVEIRSYNLKPGTRDRFHQLFVNTSLPMLHRWKVDVVAFGPSEHDKDSWFLMRGFPSLEARQKSEDAFYASEEWIKGPREAVLADIVSYATVIISIDHATLAGLRKTGARAARAEDAMSTPSSSDLTALLKLNQDYIDSVQHSNVQRFSEILADDFLCSLPDGSLIDRAQFLVADGQAGDDLEPRRPRRERPDHGRHRDRPRAHDLQHRRWKGRRGTLHRRVGAAGTDSGWPSPRTSRETEPDADTPNHTAYIATEARDTEKIYLELLRVPAAPRLRTF